MVQSMTLLLLILSSFTVKADVMPPSKFTAPLGAPELVDVWKDLESITKASGTLLQRAAPPTLAALGTGFTAAGIFEFRVATDRIDRASTDAHDMQKSDAWLNARHAVKDLALLVAEHAEEGFQSEIALQHLAHDADFLNMQVKSMYEDSKNLLKQVQHSASKYEYGAGAGFIGAATFAAAAVMTGDLVPLIGAIGACSVGGANAWWATIANNAEQMAKDLEEAMEDFMDDANALHSDIRWNPNTQGYNLTQPISQVEDDLNLLARGLETASERLKNLVPQLKNDTATFELFAKPREVSDWIHLSRRDSSPWFFLGAMSFGTMILSFGVLVVKRLQSRCQHPVPDALESAAYGYISLTA